MIFKKKLLSAAIMAATAVSLSGCLGGGGGGGSSEDDSGANNETMNVEGVAAKGILKNANITIYEVNGGVRTQLATATTDSEGRYEAELPSTPAAGIIEIVVTPGANTKMVCDVVGGCGTVAFGGEVDIPAASGMELKAIVALPEDVSAPVKTAVSPLTHMAAARVEALGSVSVDNINTAANQVLALTGVDIRESLPVDVTKPEALTAASNADKQLALYLAGLSQLIVDNGTFSPALMQNLADSFKNDGQLTASDSVKLENLNAAIDNLIQNLPPAISSTVTDALTVVSNTNNTNKEAAQEEEKALEEQEANAQLSAVQKAKNLIENVRAWGNMIREFKDDFQDGQYQSAVDAFVDREAITETFDGDTQRATQISVDILKTTIEELDPVQVRSLIGTGNPLTLPVHNDSGQFIGNLSVTAVDDNGVKIVIDGDLALDGGEDVASVDELTLHTNVPLSAFNDDYTLFETFTGDEVSLSLVGSVSVGDSSVAFQQMEVAIEADKALTYSRIPGENDSTEEEAIDAFEAMTLDGEFQVSTEGGSYTFDGQASLRVVALDDSLSSNKVSLKHVAVSGDFTSPKGSFNVGVDLLVNNAEMFDTFGLLSHDKFRWELIERPEGLLPDYSQLEGTEKEALVDSLGLMEPSISFAGVTAYSSPTSDPIYFTVGAQVETPQGDYYGYCEIEDVPVTLAQAQYFYNNEEERNAYVKNFLRSGILDDGITFYSPGYVDYQGPWSFVGNGEFWYDGENDQTRIPVAYRWNAECLDDEYWAGAYQPLVMDGYQFAIPKDELESYIKEQLDIREIDSFSVWPSYHNHEGMYVAVTSPEFEDSDYYWKGIITVNTTIDVEGLPEADAVVSFGRDSYRAATAVISLAWDDELFVFNIDADDENPVTGPTATIEVSDRAGAKVTLNLTENEEDFSGTVTVDGRQVGTISSDSGVPVVRYTDDSTTRFETLY